MLDKFRSLSTSSKVLIIGGAAVLLVCVGLIIAVIATGGFNGV